MPLYPNPFTTANDVNVPAANAGLLYVNDMQLTKTAAQQLTVAVGQCRDSSNIRDIVFMTAQVINGLFVGPNGVDLAALVASSMYAVYAIDDSTLTNPPAALLSLSTPAQGGPTIPYGYDTWQRIGWVLTDSSADILQFWQFGNGVERTYYYDVPISVLSAGSSATYANVSLAAAVPPILTTVIFKYSYTPNSAADIASFLPYGSSASAGIVVIGAGVAAVQEGMVTIPTGLNATSGLIAEVQYKVGASDSLTLLVSGFVDHLT